MLKLLRKDINLSTHIFRNWKGRNRYKYFKAERVKVGLIYIYNYILFKIGKTNYKSLKLIMQKERLISNSINNYKRLKIVPRIRIV